MPRTRGALMPMQQECLLHLQLIPTVSWFQPVDKHNIACVRVPLFMIIDAAFLSLHHFLYNGLLSALGNSSFAYFRTCGPPH